LEGISALAGLTDEARKAIEESDWTALASLMDQNFAIRRRLFGDECLGAANLDMISIAQKHGAAAKFPGSGGAIVGLCPDPSTLPAVREALESAGYVVVMVKPYCS
jgi:glucuronokinase